MPSLAEAGYCTVSLDGMKSNRRELPPKTDKLLAYLLLDRLNVEQVVDWAVGSLEAGFDTEAIGMLASMSLGHEPNLYEAKPYLSTALQELDIFEEHDRESVLRTYANSIANQLAAGLVSATSSLDEIHSAVVVPLNHPADLMGWCYLWEGNFADGSFAEMSEDETEREARAFAAKWLVGPEHNAG